VASWSELVGQLTDVLQKSGPIIATEWLQTQQTTALARIANLRRGPEGQSRNVISYASAWLQKVVPAQYTMISPEDINGFMSAMHGMTWKNGLTLILHTSGGAGQAAQTIMSYLHTKFDYIEVIIPTYAMSAGTMIALGADHLVMGRQSQLGPIDAQLGNAQGASVSAAAVVEQFKRAKDEITGSGGSIANAHVWAPILQSLGPALLQEAQNALAYGENMVAEWLEKRMCKDSSDPKKAAKEVASHFNAATIHKSHGRRIDRDEVRSKGLPVEDLESNADLQDAVLTLYHLTTIGFETSPATKAISSTTLARNWIKNYAISPGSSLPIKPAPVPAQQSRK
jgi:hypothetical protein